VKNIEEKTMGKKYNSICKNLLLLFSLCFSMSAWCSFEEQLLLAREKVDAKQYQAAYAILSGMYNQGEQSWAREDRLSVASFYILFGKTLFAGFSRLRFIFIRSAASVSSSSTTPTSASRETLVKMAEAIIASFYRAETIL